MTIILWIIQSILALLFLLHGVLFLIMPARVKEQFQKSSLSIGFGRFIGLAELLAAFGLILPDWTQILPWLTPLAAALLLPIMVGAVVSHQRSKEQPQAILCLGIIVLLLIVAIYRAFILPV
ncbi:DoxX family protein [Tengunoibacter tsumagoiensis]|nr:DoxX family protein [Tengunoibacter tsumagoiensis]